MLARGRHDAVLLGGRIPDSSGLGLHYTLLTRNPEQARRVVFMTSDLVNDDVLSHLRRTGNPYLEKPFSIDALRKALRRAPAPVVPAPAVHGTPQAPHFLHDPLIGRRKRCACGNGPLLLCCGRMTATGPRKVYVSSPYLGLEREREAVVEAVRRLEHLPIHMERYGADARPVLEKIQGDVRDADAYVLVLGWRYGEVVEGRSFTHWEYEAARGLRKPMFLYLTPERGARPALSSDDPPASAIDAWRARLRAEQAQSGSTAFVFRDVVELEKQVLADLGRWLGGAACRARSAGPVSTEGMAQIPAGALPAFWIDRCAVSNADYAVFLAASGYRPEIAKGFLEHWRGAGPPVALRRHPVVCVSWEDAAAYARWAGKDLPTQAEWERAALGEERRSFPWGSTFEGARCNTREAGRGATLPVDALPEGATPEGCLGLAGNVHEWTSTWFEPAAPRTRVVCGGSWASPLATAGLSRPENRLPGDRDHRTGFRCVWHGAPARVRA